MDVKGPAIVTGEPGHVGRIADDQEIQLLLRHGRTGPGQPLGIFRAAEFQMRVVHGHPDPRRGPCTCPRRDESRFDAVWLPDGAMTSIKLDAYDLRILATVARDGRITKRALAETVGLSPTPCWTRLARTGKGRADHRLSCSHRARDPGAGHHCDA